MARLHGIVLSECGAVLRPTLEIIPVTPSTTGPRDAYAVNLVEDALSDSYRFGRMYNVRGWQYGHLWMYRIARAFQMAPRLIDQNVGFSLSPPEMNLGDSDVFEPVYLMETIDWLKVMLRGATRSDGAKIFVEIMAQTDFGEVSDSTTRTGTYVRYFMTCTPEESRNFGNTLIKECVAARDMRARCGLAVPEDAWK